MVRDGFIFPKETEKMKTFRENQLETDLQQSLSNEKLHKEMTAKIHEIEQLIQDLAKKTDENTKLKNDVTEKTEQNKKLHLEMASKTRENEQLLKDLARKTDENTKLKKDVTEKTQEIDILLFL